MGRVGRLETGRVGPGLKEDGGRDGEQSGPTELGSSGNREGEEREEQRD